MINILLIQQKYKKILTIRKLILYNCNFQFILLFDYIVYQSSIFIIKKQIKSIIIIYKIVIRKLMKIKNNIERFSRA